MEDNFAKDFKRFQLTIGRTAITFESRLRPGLLGGSKKTTFYGIGQQWKEGILLAFGGLLGI